MKLSREAIQRMVGDRVGGGGGAGGGGGISMDDIQGMGFATQQWVGENYLSIAFFSSLFKAYTSQMVEVVPNGGDVSTIENIKAMFGFWTEQYVSSLGYNSSGGGGGGADLNLLLDNINDSNIGNIAPTASEVGKCLVYNGNNTWAWATPGGGGGGGTGTVTSITAGTGLSGGTITTSGTIAISSTYQTYISDGETAYGWGNHANAGYLTQSSLNGYATQQWADQRYVTIGTQQYITAQKTFTASLIASNDIYLNKSGQQQWVNFNNQTKNFSFGQEKGGDSVLYASGSVNFYTNINSIPYALFVQGSSGNVGIGTNNPTYKFDVSGYINTTTGYYLDGKLMANSNNGLNIGYGFAAATTPLSTTIWGEGITFRSTDGTNNYTYGGCTKIDDTHGNITYGIMATDFIGVTNKFRFEYDLRNNTVWVLKADGTAVNFASLGGVSSLGISSSGTPNISSMNIATLTATTGTIDTLNVSSMNLDLLTATTGTIDTLNATELKVGGSSASAVKKIYWDGTYLQVQIGTTTYKFRPDATA